MHFVLMIAGILSVVVGLITVALGIPERSFSVGAVLMTCGAMATIGGVILIGLASILRQLRRLIDVLEARPVSAAASSDQDAAAREPELTPVSASLSAPAARPNGSQRSELSLSPLAIDPRQSRASIDAGARSAAPEIRSPALDADEAALTPEIVVNRDAALASDVAAPSGNAGLGEPASAQSDAYKTGPAVTSPGGGELRKREPMFRGGARARAELGLSEKAAGVDGKTQATGERPAVLKSGVIEGMAYTLYADGSIDAELADGTVKFNSIPELREYLGHSQRAP